MEVGVTTGQGVGDGGDLDAAAARRRSPRWRAGDRLVTFGSQGARRTCPGVPVGEVVQRRRARRGR